MIESNNINENDDDDNNNSSNNNNSGNSGPISEEGLSSSPAG